MSELRIEEAMFIKRLRPKTYSIAVYVVALFILMEIIALGLIFYFRQTVVQIETTEATMAQAIDDSDEIKAQEESASTEVEVANLPSESLGGKSRLSIAEAEPTEEKIMKLNEEARLFRKDGDFVLAEAALKNALALDPVYPATIANLAMLEEARKDNEKAWDYWMKIIEMKGDERAEAILPLAKERAALIEERKRLESEAETREKSLFVRDRVLQIKEVKTIPNPIPTNPSYVEREFDIVSVGEKIDASKVKVQVLYYEKDQNEQLATAQINASFVSRYPDWKGDGLETLTTRWSSLNGKAYHGYLLRLYYDGKLQDARAQPASLLNRTL